MALVDTGLPIPGKGCSSAQFVQSWCLRRGVDASTVTAPRQKSGKQKNQQNTMKHILTLIAVAVSFTFGACCTQKCDKAADKCHGKPADKCEKKGDTCCAKKKK
jgi:hypothetical protein